jgi:hypothetical protein
MQKNNQHTKTEIRIQQYFIAIGIFMPTISFKPAVKKRAHIWVSVTEMQKCNKSSAVTWHSPAGVVRGLRAAVSPDL